MTLTQIGFVGLGKMGGNMVHRIRRDSDHEVVAFDFDAKAVKQARQATAPPARARCETWSSSSSAPRIVWIMVPAGEPTQETVDKLAKLLDRGDTIVDGGNSKWTDDKRRAAELQATRHRLRRRRHQRRRVGPGSRLLHDGRRPAESGQAARADPRRARARDQRAERRRDRPARLAALRPLRRRALREDGPQRRRVRADAGLRRGLRRCSTSASTSSTTPRSRTSGARARWCARGCASSPRARSRPTATSSQALEGYTEDSGEGRWTIEDATAHDVPTPVITASLYARFRSRGNGDFADRVLAALRNQFGGHAVKSAPARRSRAATRRTLTVAAATGAAGERGVREPADGGPRAAAGRAHHARDLRRHRRPRAAQTAARALQPRARGRAARALPPRRRLAQRKGARRLPRRVRGGDPPLLAAHARRGRARRACSTTSSTCPGRSTIPASTRRSRRCSTSSRRRPASRSTAPSTSRPRRASSR